MEIQWPLILFTFFNCLAGGIFLMQGILTLSGKGIVSLSTHRRGDQKFTVIVETPTRLTKEQKELLRQLDSSAETSPKRKKFAETLKRFFD